MNINIYGKNRIEYKERWITFEKAVRIKYISKHQVDIRVATDEEKKRENGEYITHRFECRRPIRHMKCLVLIELIIRSGIEEIDEITMKFNSNIEIEDGGYINDRMIINLWTSSKGGIKGITKRTTYLIRMGSLSELHLPNELKKSRYQNKDEYIYQLEGQSEIRMKRDDMVFIT